MFPKNNKIVSSNAKYVFLFKNPRDNRSLLTLGYQVYPGEPQFLKEVFAHAFSKKYAFVLMDFHQDTEENHRIIGNYLEEDKIIYARNIDIH